MAQVQPESSVILPNQTKRNQNEPEEEKFGWSLEATKTESASAAEEAIVLRENSLANSSKPTLPEYCGHSRLPSALSQNQEVGEDLTSKCG